MASTKLVIRCADWGRFSRSLLPALEHGALFVPHAAPPGPGAAVVVQLHLPEGHVVELAGTVVEAAAGEGAPAPERVGCRVALGPLLPAQQAGFDGLLGFGRGLRDGGDESASYARHLFAQATFLTPQQLGAAIAGVAGLSGPRAPRAPRAPETSHSGVRRVSAPPSRESSLPPPGESLAPNAAAGPDQQTPWHPTREPEALREALNHLSHRRYTEASQLLRDLAKRDRRDVDAYKWYFVARARRAVASNDHDRAATAYERVLRLDSHFREARDHLRQHARRRRLSAIPFSKFFSK